MTHRNISLDVLRTIAVILVLFRHIERPSDTSFFSNIIVYLQNIGWIGVDLFFTLSGYLISSLIFSEYKKNGSFDIKRFFIRRGFKIYPSFYVLILVTVLFNIFYKHREVNYKALLAELVYLQNYFGGLWNHTWSLAVEEHFYICLPLLLTYMFRSKYGFKNIKWWLLAIVFLVRLLSLIWRQQILINHEAML